MHSSFYPSGPLQGTLILPGDKSISHRAVMLASIAEGKSQLQNFLLSADTMATINAMRSLGVQIEIPAPTKIIVHGVGLSGLQTPKQVINCENSGTTLRLLAGLCTGASIPVTLIGDASLMNRPMQRISEPLKQMGADIEISSDGKPPLHVKQTKTLHAIHYRMPIASAQVKSALLLAGIYAEGKTTIEESIASRNHTELLLQSFQYPIQQNTQAIQIPGHNRLQACDIFIPGDISAAAFFMVAASIVPGSKLTLLNVGINPTRMGIISCLQRMGANITILNKRLLNFEPIADITVAYSPLTAITITAEEIPATIDEIPILCIAAANAKGTTVIYGASELRVKESDRLDAMAANLEVLGIKVKVLPDGLHINGGKYQGGTVESYNDHRIAMSFAIAALNALNPITIHGFACIASSFQDFTHYLGQIIHTH